MTNLGVPTTRKDRDHAASGRRVHNLSADLLAQRSGISPAGRVYRSLKTSTVPVYSLPKTHAKYRPQAGTQAFANGPRIKGADVQHWKFWIGTHYIYAASKGGKGWVKA